MQENNHTPASTQPERSKRGFYWPYVITAAIVLNLCAAVYTVFLSTDYPLDYDESYFAPYQQVENDFINIQAAQSAFNRRFKIRLDGGKHSRLSITKAPALLLQDGEKFRLIIYGQDAEQLKIDARIKRPQDVRPARAASFERSDNTGALTLEFSASELELGRNTLMIDAHLDLDGATAAPSALPARAASNIEPRRFLRLELCLKQCAAEFKLPDGTIH